ncbi:transcriptional regulator PhoU [Thalassovita gelatinovora]|uniref:Transcriptional regulator PhoU n=1 Tax=Thalassovita gelatinovora TaxID=53501 RepID=A0A0P1F993_THAGE|nr:aminoglycoside phosphotransferase family protein [Thalassovita gelatinovora]QIZ81181.1 aminoglycoside phosphotransferase family protein [Thalassovita gelatinovora]CUH64761.1 transcriptional regulator PhoU [Thalassovita gelatinovora]SEP92479.1 Phosphotransferase enzyme family protein [Thalassovita gelatinovora]
MANLSRGVAENLHFLCAELDGQLSNLEAYFDDPDPDKAQKVVLRAGYSYNLWSRVQSAALRGLSAKNTTREMRVQLHNAALVARNLDLIARMARRSLEHAEKVNQKALLRPETYPRVIRRVRKRIKAILPAINTRDSDMAIKIGQTKSDLDALYDQLFDTYTHDMRKSKHTEDLANSLLAANEIHRMGEALQSTSEAILSASIGQSVHFERYFSLRNILSDTDGTTGDLELEPLAETRSGSTISGVRSKDATGMAFDAVFKDGELGKMREERAGVKRWDSIYPGLAPKILSYEKSGQSAALLIEYLHGQTFEQLLLGESDALLEQAQTVLAKTLRDIWKRTRTDEPAEMASMKQLRKRLPDVFRVHPGFETGASRIGDLDLDGFETLVGRAAERETDLSAPFSVHIHGDFNLDNVIFDAPEMKIHFIDLHRSRFMDYVQDVAVFMVSNYRLQAHDAQTRRRVAQVAANVHDMATKFARSQGDKTFEYRLALGLARSFATSTRFVFDKSHARRMFVRARFLLETAIACPPGKENRLKLPIKELFRG